VVDAGKRMLEALLQSEIKRVVGLAKSLSGWVRNH